MGIDAVKGVTVSGYQSSLAAKIAPAQDTTKEAETTEAAQSQVSVLNQIAASLRTSQAENGSSESGDKKEGSKERTATMKDINDFNKIINKNTVAEFGYNEPTNRITIKIKDKETEEVIKEIPSEKALEMLAKLWEIAGALVDEKR